ncbi:LacI family transcriptional regulator [Bacillus sp. HMF5848]|uniref:LacI family DNA-binding transcriptional regulator n=1 Tax=Bacillus sp. HMF5848 TaxID=2495421 RepID=UPI000F789248|nr:LacI family DNA-binding transcriptional regulator [Bacillus sp. HMF5848]RSK26401.1 LacI family transcriptional regulator [Bacillus sp. HMF5848]
MAVTIKDVARVANVSPSTVSRVIANNPRISEKTKVRVREAMRELGYHPNMIARSLANQSTQAIGVVMPNSADKVLQNPFFPEVLRGISKSAHDNDYALYFTTGESEKEIADGVLKMVQGKRVDGIVLLYSRMDDAVLNFLFEENFPFVMIGKPYKGAETISYVDNDNYGAAMEVTDYLLSLGHTRIGFIGGSPNFVVTIERMLGYKKALHEAGIEYVDDYVIHGEFLEEGGQEAMKELLALPEPPTALLVADDLMAIGVLNLLDKIDKTIPNDISLVGFNNILLSQISRPPLTSVDIQIYQLGYQAGKSLIEEIETPSEVAKRVIVPHKLVKRQSCTPIESVRTSLLG